MKRLGPALAGVGVLLVLLGAGFLIGLSLGARSEQVRSEGKTQVETQVTAISTQDEAASEAAVLERMTAKLSGLQIEAVHETIKTEVLALGKQQAHWSEAALYDALVPLIDQGIASWLTSEVRALSESMALALTATEIAYYRDRFYHSDWLPFMVYFEIAYLKESGVKVKLP